MTSRRAVCLVCGDPMEARRFTRRFCSTRCRVKGAREALSVTVPLWDAAPTPIAVPAHKESPPAATHRPHLPLPIEVRHVPGERLSGGGPSGVGGRTSYIVAGHMFSTPREAIDFANR